MGLALIGTVCLMVRRLLGFPTPAGPFVLFVKSLLELAAQPWRLRVEPCEWPEVIADRLDAKSLR